MILLIEVIIVFIVLLLEQMVLRRVKKLLIVDIVIEKYLWGVMGVSASNVVFDNYRLVRSWRIIH